MTAENTASKKAYTALITENTASKKTYTVVSNDRETAFFTSGSYGSPRHIFSIGFVVTDEKMQDAMHQTYWVGRAQGEAEGKEKVQAEFRRIAGLKE